MVMNVTLAVGAKEIAQEGDIVTHLTALEDIASMVVLCTDKTGTLTTAQMTVYHENAAVFHGFDRKELLKLAALASNPANKDDAVDRATYQAYAFMAGFGTDVDASSSALSRDYKLVKYYGFNPMVKRTVADYVNVATGKHMRVTKGIVSNILKTTEGDGGQQWTISNFDEVAAKVLSVDATFGAAGYKTIAVAVSFDNGPMQYAGTLPIMDPPRNDTADTIQKIKFASVDVKMITGDHLNIAKELATQVGLGGSIYDNTKLWPANEARDDLVANADGFAQMMPMDKDEVITALQRQGKVVGMTGDGVNDAPALAKAQIGIAVAGATDAAQAASDIILTKEGLSPIFTAIVQSRKIFKRLKAYVIYRTCVTVQVVAFLCVLSFVYNEAFQAFYIILLALFHDLTIVTIAYDHQEASAKPERPTLLIMVVAYAMGFTLAASSTVLYAFGDLFLSMKFSTYFPYHRNPQAYKESCMFLQISNSSAFLIFCARTTGFFFTSVPALELVLSVLVSQVVVNCLLLFSGGFVVQQLEPIDIVLIWVYDVVWLLIIDIVKMSISRVVLDVETKAMEAVTSRHEASSCRGPRSLSVKSHRLKS